MKRLLIAASMFLAACMPKSDKKEGNADLSPGEKLRKGLYRENPKRFTSKEIAANNKLVAQHISIKLDSIKWVYNKDYGRQMPWFVWQVTNNTKDVITDIKALVIEHFKINPTDTTIYFGALGTHNLLLDGGKNIQPGQTYLIESWPDNTNAKSVDNAETLAFYFDDVTYTVADGSKKQVPLSIHYVDPNGMQRIN